MSTPTGHREIALQLGDVELAGTLAVPQGADGLVIFVHGSGSSRFSPRNQFVADELNDTGLGTLLFDLLTSGEEGDRRLVFDIELLADRLTQVTTQVRDTADWIAYFGASTGGGAALWAAADPQADIASIVSRGGRPDLAHPHVGEVRAPTLLLVGELDRAVIELNRQAAAAMHCEHELRIVPGATHLFDEPGTLDIVAHEARDWFLAHPVR